MSDESGNKPLAKARLSKEGEFSIEEDAPRPGWPRKIKINCTFSIELLGKDDHKDKPEGPEEA